MLLIKQNREKENKTEAQYILEGTAENLRYYRERIDALQKLEAKTPANKKKLLDEIHKPKHGWFRLIDYSTDYLPPI